MHRHHPSSPRSINEVVERYLTCIIASNHLRPSSSPGSITFKGEATDLCSFQDLHTLTLGMLQHQVIKFGANHLEAIWMAQRRKIQYPRILAPCKVPATIPLE